MVVEAMNTDTTSNTTTTPTTPTNTNNNTNTNTNTNSLTANITNTTNTKNGNPNVNVTPPPVTTTTTTTTTSSNHPIPSSDNLNIDPHTLTGNGGSGNSSTNTSPSLLTSGGGKDVPSSPSTKRVTMGTNKVLFDKDDPFMSKTYSQSVQQVIQTNTSSVSQPVSPSNSFIDDSTIKGITATLSPPATTPTSPTSSSLNFAITHKLKSGVNLNLEKELLDSLLNFPSPPKDTHLLPSPRGTSGSGNGSPNTGGSGSSIWNFASHKRGPSDVSSAVSNMTVIMHRKLSNPLSLSTSAIPEEGAANPTTGATVATATPTTDAPVAVEVTSLSKPNAAQQTAGLTVQVPSSPPTTTLPIVISPSGTTTTTTTTFTSSAVSGGGSSNSPKLVIPLLNLTSAPLQPNKPMLFYDDNESSSSEENFSYESDSDSDTDIEPIDDSEDKLLVPAKESTTQLLLELNDKLLLHILSYLYAEDYCVLYRVCKKMNTFVNQNQILWKDLTLYYLRKYQDVFDVNVWDEEMVNQSNVLSLTPIMGITPGTSKIKESTKSRSSTVSSPKDSRKAMDNINATVVGKRSTYLPSGKSTISIASLSGSGGSGASTGGGMTSSHSMNALSSLNGTIGNHVMVINSALRRLTPLTSVPPTDEVTDFIDTCHTFPLTLLLRKLLQRYLVPRTYQSHHSDADWRKMVEVPIQLRVGKLLRKVIDHKPIEFDYTSLLILKSFIKGFLLPTSEMARGLNQSVQKKITLTKCLDISKLSEGLLTRIFRLLDLNTCCTVLHVCKKWNRSVNNASLWERFYSIHKAKLCEGEEEMISIWDEINPYTYYIDINNTNTILTPNLSSATPTPTPSSLSPSASFSGSAVTTPSSSISPSSQSSTSSLNVSLPKISINTDDTNGTVAIVIEDSSISTPPKDKEPTEVNNTNTAVKITADVAEPVASQPSSSVTAEEVPDKVKPQAPDSPSTPRIKLVTLNQLVERLTSITTATDITDFNACLATYRSFTSTSKLIYKLLERYHVPKPEEAAAITVAEWKKRIEYPIQHSVYKVLKKLIDDQFNDFNQDVLDVLRIFLRYIVVETTSLPNYLRRSFTKKVVNMQKKSTTTSASASGSSLKLHDRRMSKMGGLRMMTWRAQSSEILSVPAEDIARQLTLIEFETYSKIQTSEFLNQAWVKEKTKHMAMNIRAAIDRFNQITKWVCTVICKEEKIRTRAKHMSKLLKVAMCLRSYSNYHTLMAILSGLNEAPVFRLKHTFAEMKPKIQKLSSMLQALMTVEDNHGAYRSELASIDSSNSCIPYLGVFLKDITVLQESSVDQPSDAINLKQTQKVYGVLKVIKNFQHNPYTFEENPKLRDCFTNLHILGEEELYSLSISREPRNCKRSDLV